MSFGKKQQNQRSQTPSRRTHSSHRSQSLSPLPTSAAATTSGAAAASGINISEATDQKDLDQSNRLFMLLISPGIEQTIKDNHIARLDSLSNQSYKTKEIQSIQKKIYSIYNELKKNMLFNFTELRAQILDGYLSPFQIENATKPYTQEEFCAQITNIEALVNYIEKPYIAKFYEVLHEWFETTEHPNIAEKARQKFEQGIKQSREQIVKRLRESCFTFPEPTTDSAENEIISLQFRLAVQTYIKELKTSLSTFDALTAPDTPNKDCSAKELSGFIDRSIEVHNVKVQSKTIQHLIDMCEDFLNPKTYTIKVKSSKTSKYTERTISYSPIKGFQTEDELLYLCNNIFELFLVELIYKRFYPKLNTEYQTLNTLIDETEELSKNTLETYQNLLFKNAFIEIDKTAKTFSNTINNIINSEAKGSDEDRTESLQKELKKLKNQPFEFSTAGLDDPQTNAAHLEPNTPHHEEKRIGWLFNQLKIMLENRGELETHSLSKSNPTPDLLKMARKLTAPESFESLKTSEHLSTEIQEETIDNFITKGINLGEYLNEKGQGAAHIAAIRNKKSIDHDKNKEMWMFLASFENMKFCTPDSNFLQPVHYLALYLSNINQFTAILQIISIAEFKNAREKESFNNLEQSLKLKTHTSLKNYEKIISDRQNKWIPWLIHRIFGRDVTDQKRRTEANTIREIIDKTSSDITEKHKDLTSITEAANKGKLKRSRLHRMIGRNLTNLSKDAFSQHKLILGTPDRNFLRQQKHKLKRICQSIIGRFEAKTDEAEDTSETSSVISNSDYRDQTQVKIQANQQKVSNAEKRAAVAEQKAADTAKQAAKDRAAKIAAEKQAADSAKQAAEAIARAEKLERQYAELKAQQSTASAPTTATAFADETRIHTLEKPSEARGAAAIAASQE